MSIIISRESFLGSKELLGACYSIGYKNLHRRHDNWCSLRKIWNKLLPKCIKSEIIPSFEN